MAAAPCTGQKGSTSAKRNDYNILLSVFPAAPQTQNCEPCERGRLASTVTLIAGPADRWERGWAAEPGAAVPASPVCPSGAG